MEGIPLWLQAVALGLATGLLIEVGVFLLGRLVEHFRPGLLFHWWALAAALFARFRSRQEHTFAEKVLSAMRHKFGGHLERTDEN